MLFKFLFIFGYILIGSFALQLRNWDYIVLEVYSNCTDESKIKIDLQVVRRGRGDYAISGSAVISYDFSEENFIEILAYRSASGNNQYKLLPFKVENQTMINFMDNLYKNSIAKSLANCSNAPQAEGGNPPVIKRAIYKFEQCVLSTDMLPSHMQPGYYKAHLIGTGPIEWFIKFLVKVETEV